MTQFVIEDFRIEDPDTRSDDILSMAKAMLLVAARAAHLVSSC